MTKDLKDCYDDDISIEVVEELGGVSPSEVAESSPPDDVETETAAKDVDRDDTSDNADRPSEEKDGASEELRLDQDTAKPDYVLKVNVNIPSEYQGRLRAPLLPVDLLAFLQSKNIYTVGEFLSVNLYNLGQEYASWSGSNGQKIRIGTLHTDLYRRRRTIIEYARRVITPPGWVPPSATAALARLPTAFAVAAPMPSATASVPDSLAPLKPTIRAFLLSIGVNSSTELIAKNVSELEQQYIKWREQNGQIELRPGNARAYINTWLRLVTKNNPGQMGLPPERVPELEALSEYSKALLLGLEETDEDLQPKVTPLAKDNSVYTYFTVLFREKGSLGLKIEGTRLGVRIREILPGKQGAQLGLQMGDLILSAQFDPNDEWLQEVITFEQFMQVAKTNIRPLVVRVGRERPLIPSRKRARLSKEDNVERIRRKEEKSRRKEEKLRMKEQERAAHGRPSPWWPRAICDFHAKRMEQHRLDIYRAYELRIGADVLEKNLASNDDVAKNNVASECLKKTIQQMREEWQELWNNSNHDQWETEFKKLLEFKMKEGHCIVSKNHKDKVLHKFVVTMRRQYEKVVVKAVTVPEDKLAQMNLQFSLLNKIGFTWNVTKMRTWDDSFRELVEYKEIHGNCVVPTRGFNPNGSRHLPTWVITQRRKYFEMLKHPEGEPRKPGMMTEEQAKKLTDLGMVWNASTDKTWEDYYQELLAFRAQHGHAKVPQLYSQNGLHLGNWVHRMRRYYRALQSGKRTDSLTPERFKLLEAVGFVWKTKPTPRRDYSKKRKREEVDEGETEDDKGDVDDDNEEVEDVEGEPKEQVEYSNHDSASTQSPSWDQVVTWSRDTDHNL